ncbi:hypothetical protein [Sporosarcina limicola]|uniref:Uncharacterized protein n=1 Tax=Sporosarcina limicola TaxID=34101 RepID=A0A927REN9_9BACL|nr:hypothetical protein [Sporosarcina limicola]MBE1554777.1 hypothetical protein [Sporosarcina limicola]
MVELRVIDGIKKEKPNYRRIYGKAFLNTVESIENGWEKYENIDLDSRKKMILYGVKNINATDLEILDYELLVNTFNIISGINSIMSTLTPREFQTVFPIAKEYDGKRFGVKDYFYTKKAIEKFGMDRVIGEGMKRFHWDYHNWELTDFASQAMCVMSAIRRAEGGKGIAEEFFEDKGIPTYTMTKDDKGKEILVNNDTGEVSKVSKKRPRYLKVVK